MIIARSCSQLAFGFARSSTFMSTNTRSVGRATYCPYALAIPAPHLPKPLAGLSHLVLHHLLQVCRERILWAVDQASTKLRSRLGESLATIEKYDHCRAFLSSRMLGMVIIGRRETQLAWIAIVTVSVLPSGIVTSKVTSSPGCTPLGTATLIWYEPAFPGAMPEKPTLAGTPAI